jgi:Tfp pilus assembly protein PilO
MNRLLQHLGFAGLAAIVLLAAALAFSSFAVRPLEERNQLLKDTAGRQGRKAEASPSGDKVAAVYEFLQKGEDTTDWLAKLHGIGVATGVQLKSASYRTQKTEGRIVRYEIVLPVAGNYAQIRDFLKRSLAEIPVLSLDQLALKREGKNEGTIQAEMKLTLHMVKS